VFGWLPSEIDNEYIEDLFDYVIALTAKEEEEGQYIDEIWM